MLKERRKEKKKALGVEKKNVTPKRSHLSKSGSISGLSKPTTRFSPFPPIRSRRSTLNIYA